MSAKITFEYMSQDTSQSLNEHLVDLLPAGVYRGLTVHADGTIAPGTLLTREGVRIEMDEYFLPQDAADPNLHGVVPNHGEAPRRDLVVCRYTYAAVYPAPAPRFLVLRGGVDGVCPSPLAEDVVLARCLVGLGDSAWTQIEQAGAPERLVNCRALPAGGYQLENGKFGALRLGYDMNLGVLRLYLHAPNPLLADGAEIAWGEPMLTLDKTQGLAQVASLIADLASAAPGKGASLVGVEPGHSFAAGSTNVQKALIELMQKLGALRADHTTTTSTATALKTAFTADHYQSTGLHSAIHQVVAAAGTTYASTPVPTLLFETGFGTGGTKLRFYTESLFDDDTDKTLLGMYRLVITMNAKYREAGIQKPEGTPIIAGWEADDWEQSSYRAELGDVLALYLLPKPSAGRDGSMSRLLDKRRIGQFDANGLTLASGLKLLSGEAEPADSSAPAGSLYLRSNGVVYAHMGGSGINGGWRIVPSLAEGIGTHDNEGTLNVQNYIRAGSGFQTIGCSSTINMGIEAPDTGTGRAYIPGCLYLCSNDNSLKCGLWVSDSTSTWKKVSLE